MEVAVGELQRINDEIHIPFAGCNFACPHCTVADLIEAKQEHKKELKDVITEIRELKGKTLVIKGGEPLLQRPAVVQFLKEARSLQMQTVLETNGSKSSELKSILDQKLIDVLRIAMKSPLDGTFEKITKSQTFFITTQSIIKDIQESLKIAREYDERITIEIITTIVPGLIFRKEDMEAMAAEIHDLQCTWVLEPFVPTEQTKSKIFENVSPPTEEFLQNLKEHILELHPLMRVEIRVDQQDA